MKEMVVVVNKCLTDMLYNLIIDMNFMHVMNVMDVLLK